MGKEQYYYLEHSYREGSKVHKIEKYLGKSLPKNIDELIGSPTAPPPSLFPGAPFLHCLRPLLWCGWQALFDWIGSLGM